MIDLPIYFLTETTLAPSVTIHVPRTVTSVGGMGDFVTTPPPGVTLSPNITIAGVRPEDSSDRSFIIDWAIANGVNYQEIDGEIINPDADDAWLRVPYQYIIETATSGNFALHMSVFSGALPAGLSLVQEGQTHNGLTMVSGQFYGAPLETGEFRFQVKVRSAVYDYLLDIQEITLKVREPDDAGLAATNDYEVTLHIGEPAVPGIEGNYIVREAVDQIFTAADVDLNGDGVIDATDNNFPYFVHFWLDGQVLTLGFDYKADPGSTMVTLLARILPDLDDGDVHTAAAEFSRDGRQTVAAQAFTVELAVDPHGPVEPEEPTGPEQPSGPAEPTEPEQPSGPAEPTEPEQPTGPAEPTEPEQPSGPAEPTEPEQPSGPAEPTEPEQPTVPQQPTVPEQPTAPEQPTVPQQPTVPEQPTAPEQPTVPQQPTVPEQPTTPEQPSQPTVPEQPSQPSVPEQPTAPEQPTVPQQPATPARIADSDEGGSVIVSNQTPPPGPTAALNPLQPGPAILPVLPGAPGLPLIPGLGLTVVVTPPPAAVAAPESGTGEYSLSYDGSGPLELRIDIPLAEFQALYCDGALWTPGADYEARSGSTILSVTEERLAALPGGRHVINAVFSGRAVEVAFTITRIAEGVAAVTPIPVPATQPAWPLLPLFAAVLALWVAAAWMGARLAARA
jgi:hypothetical protein